MSEEREVKIAAPASFALPDFDGVVPGLRAVDRGRHQLDATYWDSATLALHGAGFGLRYRTTDGAAGHWTLKAQSHRDGPAVVREEIDMDGEPGSPPARALAAVQAAAGGDELRPVAKLRTSRRTVDLVDAEGRRRAEIADDTVSVRADTREVSAFHEVEVEIIGDPDDTMVDAVLARLRDAGAVDIDPTSKYVRALRALGYSLPHTELP